MNKKQLPIFGIGPIYVISIFILTIIALILNYLNYINFSRFDFLKIPFIIVGIIFIILGIIMWVFSVFKSKIDKNIKENKLVTTGVYAYTRNPIYSAFLFINTGIILHTYNLILLILPIIYYIYLTILLINTEEKWLVNVFQDEYIEYKKNVNRIIPWFRKK